MKPIFYLFLLILISCQPKVYPLKTESEYNTAVYEGNYQKALSELSHHAELKKQHNEVLLCLEKGRLFFLNREFDSAVYYFNRADLGQDDWRKLSYKTIKGDRVNYFDNRYTKDGQPVPNSLDQPNMLFDNNVRGYTASVTVPNLKKPNKTEYYCYDFERPYLHIYAGLAYASSNQDGAYVEARKLVALKENLDVRKSPIHPDANYSTNPLIPLMAGILFEQQGDENAALIQYESALRAFEDKNCQLNYGVNLPVQLPLDVTRICRNLGFEDKLKLYSEKYRIDPTKMVDSGYTLIVIKDVSFTPVKQLYRVYVTPDGEMHTEKPRFVTKSKGDIIRVESNFRVKKFQESATLIGNQKYIWLEPMQERINSELTPIPTPTQGKSTHIIAHYDDRSWQSLPAQIHYERININPLDRVYYPKGSTKGYPIVGEGKCRLVYVPTYIQ